MKKNDQNNDRYLLNASGNIVGKNPNFVEMKVYNPSAGLPYTSAEAPGALLGILFFAWIIYFVHRKHPDWWEAYAWGFAFSMGLAALTHAYVFLELNQPPGFAYSRYYIPGWIRWVVFLATYFALQWLFITLTYDVHSYLSKQTMFYYVAGLAAVILFGIAKLIVKGVREASFHPARIVSVCLIGAPIVWFIGTILHTLFSGERR